jgi:hypothetical protein
MPIRFAPSAARHGIAPERAQYVVEHCPAPLYSPEPDEEDLVIYLGPDERGVPLEVMAIELADGDLLVIHAMHLRPKYRDAFERVMEWHEP